MLIMTVAIESLLAAASNDGNRDGVLSAFVSEVQILLTRMINSYEQEARQEGIRERIVLDIVAVFHPAKPTGPPAIDIPGKQLRFLVENGFKITDSYCTDVRVFLYSYYFKEVKGIQYRI